MSVATFVTALLALMPPGRAWNRSSASLQYKVLAGFAPEFDRVQQRADKMLLELSPATASELLPEHENKYGLPDACGPVPITDADRQAALIAKLQGRRGHNPADYVALCAIYGHAGATVGRRPLKQFLAGSRAGMACRGDPWVFLYAVAYMAELNPHSPNDFTGWTLTTATVTANAAHAPDGTLTADQLAFTGISFVKTSITASDPTFAQFDIYLRCASGTADINIELLSSVGGVAGILNVVVDTRWRRFSMRAKFAAGIHTIQLFGDHVTVLAWGARLGAIDTVTECELVGASQAHTVLDFRMIGDWLP